MTVSIGDPPRHHREWARDRRNRSDGEPASSRLRSHPSVRNWSSVKNTPPKLPATSNCSPMPDRNDGIVKRSRSRIGLGWRRLRRTSAVPSTTEAATDPIVRRSANPQSSLCTMPRMKPATAPTIKSTPGRSGTSPPSAGRSKVRSRRSTASTIRPMGMLAARSIASRPTRPSPADRRSGRRSDSAQPPVTPTAVAADPVRRRRASGRASLAPGRQRRRPARSGRRPGVRRSAPERRDPNRAGTPRTRSRTSVPGRTGRLPSRPARSTHRW